MFRKLDTLAPVTLVPVTLAGPDMAKAVKPAETMTAIRGTS